MFNSSINVLCTKFTPNPQILEISHPHNKMTTPNPPTVVSTITASSPSDDEEGGLVMHLINSRTTNGSSSSKVSSTTSNGNGSPWPRRQLVDVNPRSGSLDLSKLPMRRNSSYGRMPSENPEAKVLVIYTGGTIGMMRNEKNGELLIGFRVSWLAGW